MDEITLTLDMSQARAILRAIAECDAKLDDQFSDSELNDLELAAANIQQAIDQAEEEK